MDQLITKKAKSFFSVGNHSGFGKASGRDFGFNKPDIRHPISQKYPFRAKSVDRGALSHDLLG